MCIRNRVRFFANLLLKASAGEGKCSGRGCLVLASESPQQVLTWKLLGAPRRKQVVVCNAVWFSLVKKIKSGIGV